MYQDESVKRVSVQIRKTGFLWKISLRGVTLKRVFFTYAQAESYLAEVHNYFGDDCVFVTLKVA